jgi:RHS repeat-associated protein
METPGDRASLAISALTGCEYNAFGKPARVYRLQAQPLIDRCRQQPERKVAEHLQQLLIDEGLPTVEVIKYLYDGKHNCVQQDQLFDGKEQTTRFAYDPWDRVHSTTLPDRTVVNRAFAEHSVGQQVTLMEFKPGNTSEPQVAVGRQTFDSLLRLTQVSTGSANNPRVETYHYNGAQMQPSQRITALETFDYEYKPELTRQPLSVKTRSGQPATYSYDARTGGITKASNSQGERTYRYTGTGQLQHESWTDADGTVMETDYASSLLGRLISRHDTGGLETLRTYDECGRSSSVTQGALKSEFEYNRLGQLQRTTSRNQVTGVTLVTDVQYDTQGREVERVLSVSNQPTRTITQTWQGDNHLRQRDHYQGSALQLKEEFVYDARKRLVQHKCTGSRKALPKDTYGNAITQQVFRFDALDNVTQVNTRFDNGRTDVATFFYAEDDTCQLVKITHDYTDGGYRREQSFEYDANGNMLNDEQARRLVYDSQGRLIAVKDPTGQTTLITYRYDGHNHLVGVRQGNESETLRVYQGYNLSHTRKDDSYTQYLFEEDCPLGQQQLDDPDQILLLMTNASPTVIGEVLQSQVNESTYTAYGVRSSEEEIRCLLAFNSEVREELTDWYMLGRGYRAYNPNLMRFHSPDAFSPFGSGGVNPYTYCLGNPITFRDPSGHRATGGTFARPGDPGYKDPIEEPEMGFWDKFLQILIFVVAAIIAIAIAVFTAGTGLVLLATILGAIITVIGAVVGIIGVVTNNRTMVTIGTILTVIGSLLSFGAGFSSRFTGPKPAVSPPPTPRSSFDSVASRNFNESLAAEPGGSTHAINGSAQGSIYTSNTGIENDASGVGIASDSHHSTRRISLTEASGYFDDVAVTDAPTPPSPPPPSSIPLMSRGEILRNFFRPVTPKPPVWIDRIFTTEGGVRK